MKISLLYFASLREALGTGHESVELPPGIGTAGDLRKWLAARGDPWSAQFAEGRAVRVAIAKQMAATDTALFDGAEVAFFPPVTGG
ncbi:MAG: molybdopterin converting factor subunit 1 [Betaproteobacteria bacterium]|jgi:molybdopterin synthase sulfur carrier subunit